MKHINVRTRLDRIIGSSRSASRQDHVTVTTTTRAHSRHDQQRGPSYWHIVMSWTLTHSQPLTPHETSWRVLLMPKHLCPSDTRSPEVTQDKAESRLES
jgi:hypothetical protein